MTEYEVRITDGIRENYRFSCRGDEPLLYGIRRLLCREMPQGCAGGGCGICKVIIRSGDVSAFKPMSRAHVTEEELSRKVVLACCVNPRSDLEIGFFNN
jgi:ferredoxin